MAIVNIAMHINYAHLYQSSFQLIQRHDRREDVRRQYHSQKRNLKQPAIARNQSYSSADSSDDKSETKSDNESVASRSSLFRGRLVAFYNRWGPSNLETPGFVDNVLREYEGSYRDAQVFLSLQSYSRLLHMRIVTQASAVFN